MNLAELVLATAAGSPSRVAVRFEGESLTYREFVNEGARVAGGLTRLGVGAGDRVMLFSDNSLEYLVIYHAVVRLGAIFVPVHSSFQPNELEYALGNADPAVVIAQPHLWERLERCRNFPGMARLVEVGGHSSVSARFTAYANLAGDPESSVVALEPGSPALVCYTSGTTDRPHPVTRSHQTEVFNAKAYADVWDYREADVALVSLPLSWVYGLTTLSQGLLHAGATIVVHRDFDPQQVVEEVERSRVTLFAGTMSMYVALLHRVQDQDADLSSLRHLYRGGEPANVAVMEAFQRRLGLPMTDGYATTEVAPVLAMEAVRSGEAPAGTAGRLVPGAAIRIVDHRDRDVRVGEVGEALLGGPGRMLYYWREPDLTAARVTADGWFRSGDLVRQDEDGYYFVMGRSSEIIIRNGARVAPAEVEAALVGLAGIAASVAVGVPDEEFGEAIVAVVMIEPDCIVSADDVYAYLADRIARFKLPTEIIFVDDLPSSTNAKLDRRALRANVLAELGLSTSVAPIRH